MMRLAIFISGRGSNMTALIDYNYRPDAQVIPVLVLADRPAAGLAAAAERGVPTRLIDRGHYTSQADHEAAITSAVEASGADMIALAGYMRLLSAEFCEHFSGRIINIHPSLLPRHKGLNTHQRAMDAGDKTHGCTVHFVTAGMDEGTVIDQAEVAIEPHDTAASLAAKVLEEEHRLYPRAVEKISARKSMALS